MLIDQFVLFSCHLLISGEAEGLLAKANAKAGAVQLVADAIAKKVCCQSVLGCSGLVVEYRTHN